MDLFKLIEPSSTGVPVVLSIPHSGTYVPGSIKNTMTPAGLGVPDTDWYLRELYDFAPELGVTVIESNYSRYVADLNRSPDSRALYSDGRQITEVVPTVTFGGEQIYSGDRPNSESIAQRIAEYHAPYHACIERKTKELRERFGLCILFDAHSIKSQVPSIRSEAFPNFIVGTADHASCSKEIESAAFELLSAIPESTSELNSPFKGGYITRNYGSPGNNIHAVQLEMTQNRYMNEATNKIDRDKFDSTKSQLRQLFDKLIFIANSKIA